MWENICLFLCVIVLCKVQRRFEVDSCACTWHLRTQKVKGNEWVWKVMERRGGEQGGESKNVSLKVIVSHQTYSGFQCKPAIERWRLSSPQKPHQRAEESATLLSRADS